MIAEPLTRPMCSPIGDGAAAVVLVSEKKARELGIEKPVKVVASVLMSGWDHALDEEGTVDACARSAYEEAGIGPEDLDVVECHDASAPAEVVATESLGLCAKGEGGKLVEEGATRLGGRIPVNTSGGLLRKGHPVGATGIAQIVELTEQLQGRSGRRQVEGATIGLAHNGGGNIGTDAAAMCVTVLKG
jgi:acetyl-CoA acetyltransferase